MLRFKISLSSNIDHYAGADSQTISEDNSKITNDSEVISKSVLSGNDSKAEVEENTGEPAKPDNSDFLEVSEEKDGAHDEQENTGKYSVIFLNSKPILKWFDLN